LEVDVIYEDLIREGCDEETATELATLFGTISGAVEILPAYVFLRIVAPGFGRILKRNIMREVVRRSVRELSTRGILGKVFGNALLIQGTEVSEEVLQEVIQNAAVKTINEDRSLLENLPEIFVQSSIAMSPLFWVGGGATYLNIRSNMPAKMQEEMKATEEKMEQAGLPEDHAQAIALAEVLETEEGQAAVEAAQEKVAEQVPDLKEERDNKVVLLGKHLTTINKDIEARQESIKIQRERLTKITLP
ncbi:unnamed protein product, partial [marine sediment metagenome]